LNFQISSEGLIVNLLTKDRYNLFYEPLLTHFGIILMRLNCLVSFFDFLKNVNLLEMAGFCIFKNYNDFKRSKFWKSLH